MNLNTLLRHEVFSVGSGKDHQGLVDYVASRIADADEIIRSRQFPYQFPAAYPNADETTPERLGSPPDAAGLCPIHWPAASRGASAPSA